MADLKITELDALSTPLNTDLVEIVDMSATPTNKKLTWANIKATLKTYFDALYDALGSAYATGILTGIEPSQNVDITKIDITAGTYYIQGVLYTFAGVTGLAPSFGVGETARRISLDSSGLVEQAGKISNAQKQTILPVCRVNTVQGQSGAGSDLLSPLHQDYRISETGYLRRIWHEEAIGILYSSGGVISESGTPLQIDESAGAFHNAQQHRMTISGSSDIQAIEVYHVSGSWTVGTKGTLVIDSVQYDDETDLTNISNNKWVSHTLLKAPKEEDSFFLVYSQAEYASQADAEAASPTYGLFVNQAVSGLVAVASIIVQEGSASIDSIIDRRPFIGGNIGAVLGTSNLQQTYDNSTTPEIVTDVDRGALTIQRGSAADTDNVFEGKNGAGTTTFEVTGNGSIRTLGQIKASKGSDVASAAALTLGTDGNYFDITGTTTITSIDTIAIGTVVKLHFDAILILTHHATNLILPSGANITTAAGDEAVFVEYATGDWRCINYQRADGTALVSADGDKARVLAHLDSTQPIGAGSDVKVQFDRETFDVGGDFDATTNYRFTAPRNGYYLVNLQMYFNDTYSGTNTRRMKLKKNGTTDVVDLLQDAFLSGARYPRVVPTSIVLYLAATDYIEVYVNASIGTSAYGGTSAYSDARAFFAINEL